jgi:hypothetical protein
MIEEVVRIGFLDMQVCVPEEWTDEQIIAFAESKNPCGTGLGWTVRTDEALLAGCPARNPCSKSTRKGFVHVTLDA